MSDVTLPNTIDAPTVSTSEVQGNDEALRDHINSSAWVDDDKLASPNNSVWRTIHSSWALVDPDEGTGTYALANRITDPISSTDFIISGTTFANDSTPHRPLACPFLYLDDADYTVAGKTTQLRVRGLAFTNGTAPASTFTFGLYPVTFSGGADSLIATLGTVVTSSTAAIAAPAANSAVKADSSAFSVPADGAYALGVVISGASVANNAIPMLAGHLEMRHT